MAELTWELSGVGGFEMISQVLFARFYDLIDRFVML